MLALVLLGTSSARADLKAECTEAYEQGQILRRKGELVHAYEQLLVCARECSPALRKDCLQWYAEVEVALPSIVVAAHTRDGVDVVDARVSIDDRVIAEKLDGRGIPVDPGAHTLRVERAGMPAVERKIVVREGEKLREVAVVFGEPPGPAPSLEATHPPSPPPAPESSAASLPLPMWIAGAVGVVALGTFATFGALGRSEHSTRLDRCNPNCSPDEVQSVRTKYIVADVSLGIAVVSFAISAYFFLTQTRPAHAAHAPGR
jgi:hypothetical protein